MTFIHLSGARCWVDSDFIVKPLLAICLTRFYIGNYIGNGFADRELRLTKREKRLQKVRQNPKNVSFDELKQVLEDHGFEHIRTSGSHHTFVAIIGEQNWRVTIPFHRPIKAPYIREALRAIDEIRDVTEEVEDDDSDS